MQRAGFFTQKFLQSLPDDATQALVRIGREFTRLVDSDGNQANYEEDDHKDYLETLALLSAYCKSRDVKLELPRIGHGWRSDR